MRVAARWMTSTGFRDRRSGSGPVTLECRCLHQDRGKRIPQVMSHDAEHLIAELRGVDRSAVETCILDCHSRPVRQPLRPNEDRPVR